MTRGLPVGRAAVCLVLTIAFANAAFSTPAPAEPRDLETSAPPGDALEQLITDLTVTQCHAENAVAHKFGGAIKRRYSGCIAEAQDRARPIEDMKGKLRPPVSGAIVRHFGEKDGGGRLSNGITLRTRPGAQVVAPFDSNIMSAGDHEDYGKLLILSAGGGYHFVLAGMTKIYGVKRQKLLEGEPVGVMSGTGDATATNAGPELYFEIRENGKPIDPLPWLATARLERTSQ